jgi:ABC-type glycerol-3-phosphate transport system substrate-binding protein
MSTMRRAMATLAVLLCALTLTAGCGDDESSPPSGSSSDPKVIEVTFDGDSVTPNGERVEVAVGQEIELKVTADAPGEIHVHSSPEQELEYNKGETTVTIQGIDQPGTVDVESHSLEKVIVQLEVH